MNMSDGVDAAIAWQVFEVNELSEAHQWLIIQQILMDDLGDLRMMVMDLIIGWIKP